MIPLQNQGAFLDVVGAVTPTFQKLRFTIGHTFPTSTFKPARAASKLKGIHK